MEITVQYFDDCPNWKTTAAHLNTLVDDGFDAAIRYELIDTHEVAVARKFHGSPTVLIDGADAFSEDNAHVGLACRVYQTEDGFAGSPSLDQLRAVIASAESRS